MGGGLERRCVGRVYGADGAVARHNPQGVYMYLSPNIARDHINMLMSVT